MILGTNTSVAQGDADNFYKSNSVNTEKVSFSNQYKMKVGARLFLPKELEEGRKYPAVIVGHPMGAVKEQSAGLYPRNWPNAGSSRWHSTSPSGVKATENRAMPSCRMSIRRTSARRWISSAPAPLSSRERIGVVGICGSGSFAISAAKIDPRLKAIATVSMYDMGAASRNGLKHALSPGERKRIIAQAAEQRYAEFLGAGNPFTPAAQYTN